MLSEIILEKVARLLKYLIHISNRACALLDCQYIPVQEALKPTPLISFYSAQVNAMKQLLY